MVEQLELQPILVAIRKCNHFKFNTIVCKYKELRVGFKVNAVRLQNSLMNLKYSY